jgi:8-amino-7-oxononanoate synthase
MPTGTHSAITIWRAWRASLKQAKGICYVVIESVYSMDGDTPPIADILTLTEQYGAHLIIDEAHAVGLYPSRIG